MDLQSSDKRLGLCQKASGIEEASEEAASALAMAEDSSDYIRNLRTRAEFGCVMFEVPEGAAPVVSILEQRFEDTLNRMHKALQVAERFGGIPGDQHRTWVIDQMVRALMGDAYDDWVRRQRERDGGPWEWDVGIHP